MRLESYMKPDEQGLYICCVKTGFRPYDVGVTAALLIAKRYLRDQLMVHSNGLDPQWLDARRVCQRVLGYGDWFGIVEEKITQDWPGQEGVIVRRLIETQPPEM